VAQAAIPSLQSQTIAPLTEEIIQQTIILNLQLQQINAKLLTVARDALIIEQDPNRSASPPPKYDSNGKRTNTREVRMREALTQERIAVIEALIKLNPHYVPPSDFVKQKPTKKIYMPKNADPNFNYIGLIIGPRGNTQKQMELETSCKISIRGKGSAKEGSKGRAAKNVDDDDELHVHIQGDTMDNVEKAAKLIEAILRPVDDTLNEHKQKQLRELALINGTLREDEYCPVCGEKGHRQFDCPYRAKAFKAAGVKCAICGDLSHPTRDCPLKDDGPQNLGTLDSEYDSFLAELSGKEKPSVPVSGSSIKGNSSNNDKQENSGGKSGPQELDPMGGIESRVPIQLPTLLTSNMPSMYGVAMPTLPATPTMSIPGYPMWSGIASAPMPPKPAVPPPPSQPMAPPPPPVPAPPSAPVPQTAPGSVYGYPAMYAGMCYPGAYTDPATAAYYAQYAAYYAQSQQQSSDQNNN
jgi:hypothetical protein